jgi:hypothetical protein
MEGVLDNAQLTHQSRDGSNMYSHRSLFIVIVSLFMFNHSSYLKIFIQICKIIIYF